MITHTDIIPVHRVDQIKIPPHEPVIPVHAVKSALENAGPRIKFSAGFEAIALEQFWRHAVRLKWNPVVAVAFVEPPIFVEQATLGFQPGIERRAGKWREMIEGRDVKRVFSSKLHRFSKTLRSIPIITENERAIHADVMTTQIRQRLLESTTHGVERLVHVFEVLRIQTLKSNQHALTTAAFQQI